MVRLTPKRLLVIEKYKRFPSSAASPSAHGPPVAARAVVDVKKRTERPGERSNRRGFR